MSDQDEQLNYEEALALQSRARAKLERVEERTPELHDLARRLDHWGRVNHLAQKIHKALRG